MRGALAILIIGISLTASLTARADDVIWDFEGGNDHGFTLTSVNPATPAPDDPTTAGDEALTGVGGSAGLPEAGVAWSIGRPDQFDGMKPAFQEGDKARADGTMEYNQAGTNHPFTFPINGRGQESYLNTYNLTQYGDHVHTGDNDQIAKSPLVLLGEGAVLTVWAQGGGSGTHAPELDPDPAAGYTTDSSGIAVLSADDGTLLASVLTDGHGTLREDTIDLSAYAGQKVRIEVVDAFDGSWGWLAVDEIRITDAVSLGAAPQQATNPDPPDKAIDVPLDVVLHWTAGEYAPEVEGHQVYFGESFDDVNQGLAGVSRAVTSDPVFDTAGLSIPLEFQTTYYWRIDEANDVTGWDKGQVWSFTTEPYAYPVENVIATSNGVSDFGPQKTVDGSGLSEDDQHSIEASDMWLATAPEDEALWIQYEFEEVLKLRELLVWNYNVMFEPVLGFGVQDVTIEYSTDGSEWTTLGETQFQQATARADYEANTAVDLGGIAARYVRITVNGNFGGMPQYGLSEVRFLQIPVQAREPQPTSGATDVPVDSILRWRAGREAVTHEVFIGTDEQAVLDGTASVEAVTESQVTPDALEYAQVYYWKVNEVGAESTWEGPVWTFSTAEFQVVEDFESYNDNIDAGTTIFDTWIDGWTNGTGSTVGYFDAPFAERTIVRNGRQAMPLFYDNTDIAMSEATYSFPAENWTANGIKSLSLWFYGDPDNTGQLYIKINGTKVAYNGGTADIQRAQWQPWNIDLSAIGVSVENVTDLAIGIEGAGAKGVLYIDDIRLYPKTPVMLVPVEPARTGLLAEYLFDDGANDTSGNGNDGTFLGQAHVADSHLVLDGTDDAVFIPRLGGATATHDLCTYSMWMYSSTKPEVSAFIGGINYDNWSEGGGIHCKVRDGVVNVGVSGVPGGDLNGTTIIDADEWFHEGLTVTHDEVTLYLNGQVEATRSFTGPVDMILGRGCIGAYRDNNDIQRELKGQMDDVRIYNRAVTPEEMLWLAGRREPAHKPF